MHSELIDLLYENDAVEGVALFQTGQLAENQLALSEASVTQICSCIYEIQQGLADAGRLMQGFLIKNSKYLLQAFLHNDLVILLQVTPSYSPEQTYQALSSQLGKTSSPSLPPAATEQTQKPAAEKVAVETAVVEEADDSSHIDWSEFQQKLSSLIKRVAPGGVAKSMISAAIKEAGASEEDARIAPETAFEIGNSVVAKIPNASRRKIIEKEYQALVKKFQA